MDNPQCFQKSGFEKFSGALPDNDSGYFYLPSQKTTGLSVDECANAVCATAGCRPEN